MPDPTTPTWRLVPVGPTREIVTAMIREAAFQDIALSVDAAIHIYREAMRASPAPQELPPVQLPEPFDYCYEWDGPYGTRKFSANQWNGRKPDRAVALYTADQLRAAIAADRRAGGR